MKSFKFLPVITLFLLIASCSSDDSPDPTAITTSAFTANLDENPTETSSLGTISATSDGSAITYAIVSQTPSGALSIDTTTGEISTADLSAFDYEANTEVTASISLTADGITETTTATVSINDIRDIIYTHIATAANNIENLTVLDHPDLNGNPDANIVVTHYWNPNGIYNNNVTGVWYDGNNWTIYNEDFNVDIIENTAYNILISKDGDFITHVTTSTDWISTIDDPSINNNPDAKLIVSSYFNPNSIYNNNNLAVLYDGTIEKWRVFNESGTSLPMNAAINISVLSDNATEITHETTAASIAEDGLSQTSSIDNSLLDGNPDARFVITHDRTDNALLDKTLGAYYTGSKWTFFTEDVSTIPEGMKINIKIIE